MSARKTAVKTVKRAQKPKAANTHSKGDNVTKTVSIATELVPRIDARIAELQKRYPTVKMTYSLYFRTLAEIDERNRPNIFDSPAAA